MRFIPDNFRVTTFRRLPEIDRFDPEKFFREDNEEGIRLKINETFRRTFFQESYSYLQTPQLEVRGLALKQGIEPDSVIYDKLSTYSMFRLPHVFSLLQMQPELEAGDLVPWPGENFFYIFPPDCKELKRLVIAGEKEVVDSSTLTPIATRYWEVRVDDFDSRRECSPVDQVFAYWY